ncbi:MAG: hypothetical protein E6J34_13720 [Chloroflexi bacterium]|nr:MAG: hypothetical protein E6J34_13720 [Chloroflexota bacterium]
MQQVGDFSLTLQILPAQFNQTNVATLLIRDRNGNPVTNAQVQLTINMAVMDMGTAHVTMSSDKTLYVTKLDKGIISMTGLWNIDASIQLPGQTTFKTRFQVMFV